MVFTEHSYATHLYKYVYVRTYITTQFIKAGCFYHIPAMYHIPATYIYACVIA